MVGIVVDGGDDLRSRSWVSSRGVGVSRQRWVGTLRRARGIVTRLSTRSSGLRRDSSLRDTVGACRLQTGRARGGGLDRSRGDRSLALRAGGRSRGDCGLALCARGRLSFEATALEEGRAEVFSRRNRDNGSRRGSRSYLGHSAFADSVGLSGSEAKRDLARSGDCGGLRSSDRLGDGIGNGADAEDGRAVRLAVISLEKCDHVGNRLAFWCQLSNGCASRSQEDERTGEHYIRVLSKETIA
jgi:hypothetical protein